MNRNAFVSARIGIDPQDAYKGIVSLAKRTSF
jgi:hypothetical protein